MPEPDCLLRYRMHCNTEFYYVGKIPPIGIGRASANGFTIVLFTASRRNNFVGGKCALVDSALSDIYNWHVVSVVKCLEG